MDLKLFEIDAGRLAATAADSVLNRVAGQAALESHLDALRDLAITPPGFI